MFDRHNARKGVLLKSFIVECLRCKNEHIITLSTKPFHVGRPKRSDVMFCKSFRLLLFSCITYNFFFLLHYYIQLFSSELLRFGIFEKFN